MYLQSNYCNGVHLDMMKTKGILQSRIENFDLIPSGNIVMHQKRIESLKLKLEFFVSILPVV